ncbi:MAG TPA: aldehyde ferredoxin oxidoreductase [Desulfobulbaceae bacterium]|nr:aldehyde ferredoxin oxidoreductase [Desulfobulbaceae bacterium]
MNPEIFRILVVDLTTGKGQVRKIDERANSVGGSGLAALLFEQYGDPKRPWHDPDQPFILAVGPLTGLFPLMSKTVSSFKSPYHDQYTESHAGGRCALALRFAGYDALVLRGRAASLSCLSIGANHLQLQPTGFMAGMDAMATGKLMRRMFRKNSGHRSMLRIGPAGEKGLAMACINVDTYRHFGRLGGGAVLGRKNIKGIVIQGDDNFSLPSDKDYSSLVARVHAMVTDTDMLRKYHNLGTPANLQTLNDISSLPWRNLQQTSDPGITGITGKRFADETLLRNGACAGCPVGCIHIGCIREKFEEKDNRYLYHQVAYDYEPIFAAGSMLGITNTFDVLRILDVMEKVGVDSMSAGVALAWATEAVDKGLLSEKETIVSLQFGKTEGYIQAAQLLGTAANTFYRLLGRGTGAAAKQYGGVDFACVLGQEMAGYATGEVFFAAQSLGFRHSHLDTGAYSYDQKHADKDPQAVIDFLLADEACRCLLTSMVSCLFARSVYTEEVLSDCLRVSGYADMVENLTSCGREIRARRWRLRFATGFRPEQISLPKRFYRVKTWKGPVDTGYLDLLKKEYGNRIAALAASAG